MFLFPSVNIYISMNFKNYIHLRNVGILLSQLWMPFGKTVFFNTQVYTASQSILHKETRSFLRFSRLKTYFCLENYLGYN